MSQKLKLDSLTLQSQCHLQKQPVYDKHYYLRQDKQKPEKQSTSNFTRKEIPEV